MSNVLNTREVLPPVYNSSMGNPPVGPEEDPVLLQQALNQNVKQKLVQNSLDPLGALVKVLQGKAPSNQAEAELMAGFLEQQLNQR